LNGPINGPIRDNKIQNLHIACIENSTLVEDLDDLNNNATLWQEDPGQCHKMSPNSSLNTLFKKSSHHNLDGV
jgi:hypothetical protein